MQGHGIVKRLLGESGLYRNRSCLQYFRGIGTDHVQAEDFLGRVLDMQAPETECLWVSVAFCFMQEEAERPRHAHRSGGSGVLGI